MKIKITDTKETLIKALVEDYDIVESELENKTKKELWKMIQNLETDEFYIETEEKENMEPEKQKDNFIPTIKDYEWHDYVMSHFHKDELIDGCPKVDGMRRVCELLVGEIFAIDSDIVQTPTPENERRATVRVSVTIIKPDNTDVRYTGAADVYVGNTQGVYAYHPVALAETRAEGRALKRALRLRNVVSAEEVDAGGKVDEVLTGEQNQPINDTQKTFIYMVCSKERLNLNVEKTILYLNNKIKNASSIKYGEAKELIMKLDEYNRKPDTIPEEIKGFDQGFKFV